MNFEIKKMEIPSIPEFNFDELKAELQEKTTKYENMLYNDNEITQAKKDRADLNKLKKAINDGRIQKEKEYMAPTTSTAKTTSSAPVTTITTTQPVQEKTKLGDVNFDNKVDSVDASLILAEYAKISTNQNTTFNEKQFTAGDVDGTNVIDSVDASRVLAYYSYTSTGGKLSDMRDWMELTAEAPKKED